MIHGASVQDPGGCDHPSLRCTALDCYHRYILNKEEGKPSIERLKLHDAFDFFFYLLEFHFAKKEKKIMFFSSRFQKNTGCPKKAFTRSTKSADEGKLYAFPLYSENLAPWVLCPGMK